jgi:hypothetical protein
VTLDPREFGEPFRPEHEPDQEVGVEEKGHRAEARRGVRPPSGFHSQDQRSAWSTRGTRRRRRYRRPGAPVLPLGTSSRRRTSRRPFRWTTMTSPWTASSRRRNHCRRASEGVTFFIRTMYKSGCLRVKVCVRRMRP